MITLIISFLVLVALLIRHKINVIIEEYIKHLFRESKITEPKKQFEIVDVEERIGCIGKLDDKDIPAQIKLSDGRLFEYYSLATESKPGYYLSKDPSKTYMIVDGKLLFSLVS